MDEAEIERRAREIHESVLTIDTHDDIPYNFATPEVDPLNADRQVNLEKMRAGGLDVGSSSSTWARPIARRRTTRLRSRVR